MLDSRNPTVYFNAADRNAGAIVELIQQGKTVVNSSRPIPGDETWEGDFRHGIFYAAGYWVDYLAHWKNLDAWEVKVTTNEEIMDLLWEHAAKIGKGAIEILGKMEPKKIQELAFSLLSMPYYIEKQEQE